MNHSYSRSSLFQKTWSLSYSTSIQEMTTNKQELLIEKAISGDVEALLELLQEMKPELRRFVIARLSQSKRIQLQEDDVLQESFIKVCKEISSLKINNMKGLMAWIKAIALNQIRDAARRQSTKKRGGDRAKIELDRDDFNDRTIGLAIELSDPGILTPSTNVQRREAIDAMQFAISQLPKDQQQAMQLHYFQLYTLNETALRMQRTSDSVRGLIQRAKKALRVAMIASSLWLSHQ